MSEIDYDECVCPRCRRPFRIGRDSFDGDRYTCRSDRFLPSAGRALYGCGREFTALEARVAAGVTFRRPDQRIVDVADLRRIADAINWSGDRLLTDEEQWALEFIATLTDDE